MPSIRVLGNHCGCFLHEYHGLLIHSMKGRISIQYTIWCGRCSRWDYLPEVGKVKNSPTCVAKDLGFKFIKTEGWVCPDCQGIVGFKPKDSWLVDGVCLKNLDDIEINNNINKH